MNNARRIGIFGGTFDPIHNTHLDIARAAREQVELDRVLLVVAAWPPHKRNGTIAPAEDRYALVQAAVAGEDGLEASRLELDRDGPSYTADTLRQAHELFPEATLYLILGLDSLVDLPRWRDHREILECARLLVIPRPGETRVPPEVDGRYETLTFPISRLSSTELRERIRAGEPIDDLTPPPVARLIREKGLYNASPEDSQSG